MNDKYDETLNITFTGELFRHTKTFNRIQRSNYGTGCDSFKKIVEYREDLCYIPNENECFRKRLEFLYKKDFSQQYRDFIKESQRNKIKMTSTKLQPFCKKHNFNLGVYDPNQKRFLPLSEKESLACFYIQKNPVFVIWKTFKTTFTDAIEELDNIFEYEPNHISVNILKQFVE